jgi:hypothetical protein
MSPSRAEVDRVFEETEDRIMGGKPLMRAVVSSDRDLSFLIGGQQVVRVIVDPSIGSLALTLRPDKRHPSPGAVVLTISATVPLVDERPSTPGFAQASSHD